ncbi:MAG: DUF502 domain-containing protein [Gemmatimonadales bacterium]
MRRLFRYFVQGLILTVPLAVTAYVCFLAFTKIDGWLGVRIPGVGFLATLALITLVGFLGTTLVTRTLLSTFEEGLTHLPFVRLVYTSTKDLLNAFVGEKRRFDKPVVVALTADGAVRGMGFITQESADSLGAHESVVVYFPQSYAFAGWTFVVPASRVTRVEGISSEFMAFVVSGGVTDVPRIK